MPDDMGSVLSACRMKMNDKTGVKFFIGGHSIGTCAAEGKLVCRSSQYGGVTSALSESDLI